MKNKRNIINWIVLICWMAFIFYMSNQTANVSDLQSGGVINTLSKFGINLDEFFGELANFIVRKCAHFLEYMILAFLLFNVVKQYFKFKQGTIITVVFVFLYACTDEFHQLFVLGREGAFRDVIIDTFGGIALVLILVIKLYVKKRNIIKIN